jgi:hypothetical protein
MECLRLPLLEISQIYELLIVRCNGNNHRPYPDRASFYQVDIYIFDAFELAQV